MRISMFLLALLVPAILVANDKYPYEWEKNRQRYQLSETEEQLPEIILKEHAEFHYALENDQFLMYTIYHRIVRVNTTEAIQRHNRISISMDGAIELVDVKARSISPNDAVVSLDMNSLKEVKDADNKKGMRIFAMEGVEIGSEIEYYVIRKMPATLFGRTYFQMDVPIREASFALKCPKHLIYDFKSYNGFPAVTTDTTETEYVYRASMEMVPALGEEPYGYHVAHRKRIEYKLAYNTSKSRARLYTWDDAGKHFYRSLYTLEKDDEKALDKFVKGLKDDPSKPLTSRIRHIERVVKSTIQVETERNDAVLGKIASIAKYRIASRYGMTKLLIHSFSRLGISARAVITCSREHAAFDDAFDSWNFLDEYILHFPETKGFLSPYNPGLRYPLVEAGFVSQKGLMIEPVEIGTIKSGLATICDITAPSHEMSAEILDITVDFNAELSDNDITVKRKLRGYDASYIAPYYHLMSEEQKFQMVEEISKHTAPGLTIKAWDGKTVLSDEVDEFDLNVTFTSSHFIERAGPRVLFKAGLLIGPQTQLYRDDDRVLPIQNPYNRSFERVIKVNIPDGYAIRNAEDLNFNVLYEDGDSTPFSFVSSYSMDGSLLTIVVNEYYKQIDAPLDRYEDFRKVINAAADFNKVVLVLERVSAE